MAHRTAAVHLGVNVLLLMYIEEKMYWYLRNTKKQNTGWAIIRGVCIDR